MAVAPAPPHTFGLGLNLRDGPDAVDPANAIDALNVRFTERGILRTREGASWRYSAGRGASYPHLLAPFRIADEPHVFVGDSRGVVSVRLRDNVVSARQTSRNDVECWTVARIGTPGAEMVFVCDGGGAIYCYRVTGPVWSQPAITWDGVAAGGLGQARLVDVTADGRLALCGYQHGSAGPNGEPSDPTMIYFSEPSDPLSFKTGVFARAGADDGEGIMATIRWRELWFVFKRTSFWVFTGTSTIAGVASFQRRQVAAGIGCVGPAALCAGRDGVYFVGEHGVYRTTGGEPVLVSELVEPIFSGREAFYFRGGMLNRKARERIRMAWHDDTVYLSYPAGLSIVPNRQLVFDTRFGWWSLYDLPAGALASLDGRLAVADALEQGPGEQRILTLDEEAVGDVLNGMPRFFTARWRSGWFDYGDTRVKTLFETKLWSSGGFKLGLSKDFRLGFEGVRAVPPPLRDTWGDGQPHQDSVPGVDNRWGLTDIFEGGGDGIDRWGPGDGDLWGPSSAIGPYEVRLSIRGTHFSFQLAGDVGTPPVLVPNRPGIFEYDKQLLPWSVHRLAHHLAEVGYPSTTRRD